MAIVDGGKAADLLEGASRAGDGDDARLDADLDTVRDDDFLVLVDLLHLSRGRTGSACVFRVIVGMHSRANDATASFETTDVAK